MHDATAPVRIRQQRSLMSGALLARFLFIVLGTVLLVVLPSPYPAWLRYGAVAVWVGQGIIAARGLRLAESADDVRRISRALLLVDSAVSVLIVYLYLPVYHEAWAFLLLLIVFGSTQDRQIAAFGTGTISACVVLANYFFPAAKQLEPVRPGDLAMQLAVIAMMTAGVDVLYRSITSRTSMIAQHSVELQRAADTQSALRQASAEQSQRMRKAIDLAVTLMREHELGPLLDRILDVTTDTFGFRCGAIMTAERDREVYAYRSVRGYAPEQARRLMVREVPFAQATLKLDPRFAIRGTAYYAPVERQSWHTDPLTCYRPEAALVPRTQRGAWHEADTLIFTLTSSSGQIIGLLCPDAPLDDLVPGDETIDNVAHFAKIAAAAIENVYYETLEPQREAGARVAKTLELTAAIFTERNLDTLLHRILSAACDNFGFNAGTILLRESAADAFVRRAAVGYPHEVEGAEISGGSLREMMNERTRVRDTFYYAPMELNVQGGITRDPSRAILPRVETGQWHENDLLLFPIFDSNGALIGILTPDDPKDRRVPGYETIQALETFARIAGLAIETALIRAMASSNAARL